MHKSMIVVIALSALAAGCVRTEENFVRPGSQDFPPSPDDDPTSGVLYDEAPVTWIERPCGTPLPPDPDAIDTSHLPHLLDGDWNGAMRVGFVQKFLPVRENFPCRRQYSVVYTAFVDFDLEDYIEIVPTSDGTDLRARRTAAMLTGELLVDFERVSGDCPLPTVALRRRKPGGSTITLPVRRVSNEGDVDYDPDTLFGPTATVQDSVGGVLVYNMDRILQRYYRSDELLTSWMFLTIDMRQSDEDDPAFQIGSNDECTYLLTNPRLRVDAVRVSRD